MPQQWRIHLYLRNRDGASPEQLQQEFGIPAEEITTHIEAARLCFEKQCLLARVTSLHQLRNTRAMGAARN